MGLDQAVRKMTPETAEKVIAWQTKEWEDLDQREEYQIGEEEYKTITQLWTGRKENHIQRAIEEIMGERVQNCNYLFLSKERVEDLVNRLSAVNNDHSKAELLLPTQEGFFYGSTEFDEWYFKDIESELLDFQQILDEWDPDSRYAYWAWW